MRFNEWSWLLFCIFMSHQDNHMIMNIILTSRWSKCYQLEIALSLALCYFVPVFFSLFSTEITSLGEERVNLSTFRTFVQFALVWFCLVPLPLGVWEELRFVIVALPGPFSFLFFPKYSRFLLSQSPRHFLKYFEIYIPQHIRFAELRKNKLNNHVSQMNMQSDLWI